LDYVPSYVNRRIKPTAVANYVDFPSQTGADSKGRHRLLPGTTSDFSICLTADYAYAETSADDAVFAAAYHELKRVAHRHLRVWSSNATLNTTELVHEAFLKLSTRGDDWDSRAHFFAAASRAMRQILVDFARRRNAAKRGKGTPAITLGDAHARVDIKLDEFLALDDALHRLDVVSPRLREVVELRFFGGVPEQDIARMCNVSTRTIERDWLKAKMFLLNELGRSGL
jgi:RNA polymerase sigma factor (TIGR02999 family)